MKKQLQRIALILVSIMLMLGYGNAAFFDLTLSILYIIKLPIVIKAKTIPNPGTLTLGVFSITAPTK